jgi:CO/xanthine dehydrogenase Mo-binding subunit
MTTVEQPGSLVGEPVRRVEDAPHIMRLLMTAFVFGIPKTTMRCIALHVGGGFGTKIFLYPEYVLVATLAEKVERPVKWVESRRENYVATNHGRDHITYLELGAKRDGTITAFKAKTYANLGGLLSTIAPGIPTTLYGRMLSGAYRIPKIHCQVLGVYTNNARPPEARRATDRRGGNASPSQPKLATRVLCGNGERAPRSPRSSRAGLRLRRRCGSGCRPRCGHSRPRT